MANHPERQGTRWGLEDDHATTSHPVPQPLVDPNLDQVVEYDFTSCVLKDTTLNDYSLVRQVDLVGAPSPRASGQHAKARHDKDCPQASRYSWKKWTWLEENQKSAAMSAVANAGAHKPRLTGVTEITCSSSSRHFDRFAMIQC